MTEVDLIARIRRRATTRGDVILGIGDDAALLCVPAGKWLVVTTDTLNAGVHFPANTAPADIGWKALAVNLSDLAAMGAQPAWCTLSLSLPDGDPAWLEGFLDGYLALSGLHQVSLVGGDTARGPLSICITAHGFVDPERAMRRDGAKDGDDIWVTGTLGDAAGALAQWQTGKLIHASLRERLDRPTPRVAAGLALAETAHACIDISDGLLADLGHLCLASDVGAELQVDALPASPALLATFDRDLRRSLQASAGDDYELCFTAPQTAQRAIARIAQDADLAMTRVGRVVAGAGVRAVLDDGNAWTPSRRGYEHFGN